MGYKTSHTLEYIAWGSGIIVLGIVLYLPIWVIILATGIVFFILGVVHYSWG